MLITLGWIWLGFIIGFLLGAFVISMLASGKQADLESELLHLKFVRDSLKDEIFKIDNRAKPKPRKKRKNPTKK